MKIVLVSALMMMPLYWLCLCNHVCVVSGQCLDDQKSLLLQFQNNLTFTSERSDMLSSWNASDDCCMWMGVTCDKEGHVTDLFLENEPISGSFDDSSALFGLQYLQSFVGSFTDLAGALPRSIGNMRNSKLDLFHCGFNGTIPDSLTNLTNLSYLDLSNNYFTGPMISFAMAKNLTDLLLSSNDLSGIIPSSYFKGLHNLVFVDLSYNSFTGSIPSSLFTLPRLQTILLVQNNFSQLDEFINVSFSVLDTLDLSSNYLSGSIPTPIFQLSNLSTLDLSSNKFNGPVQLNKFFELKNLATLMLSYNDLSVNVDVTNVNQSSFHSLEILSMASCNLKTFPNFLKNQSSVTFLDLSDNHIQGLVPNWIWKLEYLNISHNLFTDFEGPLQNLTSNLITLDLHYNTLQGPIPVFRTNTFGGYFDFSTNKFSSLIPQDMGNNNQMMFFLYLSNNMLYGNIPDSFCNSIYLQVLDLSNNNISGTIPACLMSGIEILNLKNNNLSGHIPDTNPFLCFLRTLNLHGNQLDGSIPEFLTHCSKLEVLDLGSNLLSGGFPCFLNEISTLRVFILRNNKFQGSLKCLKDSKTLEMLQIVDIAFNNFSGKLPGKYFSTWKGYIMHNTEEVVLNYIVQPVLDIRDDLYYQDSVTVISKGLQMELVKILTIFTTIDFSSNHFEGPIPEELMELKELYILNLSNNALSGEIPSSIGNLKQLESFDLSKNSLRGEIPMQLASLSFLSCLDLSFNHLVGKIPTSTQLQSFSASSFEGNDALYGPPLTQNPPGGKEREVPPQQECGRLTCTVDWNFISVELGLVFGHIIVFGPLMIWKQWRIWYWQLVHKILCWIFPQLYLEYVTRRGQTYTTLRWMH